MSGSGVRQRRRHRIMIPVLVSALMIVTTLVTRTIDQPDQTDAGFLSPLATGDDGGRRLAASLAGRGVEVRRETDTLAALRATRSGPATLFVPAPELLHPQTVDYLGLLPGHTRLVLVDPPRRVLAAAGIPLRPAGRRWAAQAVDPHRTGPCALTEVTGATAAVTRQRYAPTGTPGSADLCYSAGLARVPGPTESVVVGASDPFRNGRIGEWDNQRFATGLLATTGRVLWLDLDGPAPAPPTPSAVPAPPPPEPDDDTYGEPGDDQDDLGTGDGAAPTPHDQPDGNASGSGGPGREQHANPLWSAFPPWFWALLAQLALAALLIAAARARRFGPPTPEPLPVTVSAAETVLGRARLYQQAKAHRSTAEVLRAAAKARLGNRLHLPADAPSADVAAVVAADTGEHPDTVRELLAGDAPGTDHELLELASDLDRAARDPHPSGTRPPLPRTEGDTR
ncbi:DUF4350 domain-containing protein [Micromonospora zingiberis]|uniref:DUF4350 domain-containing protein n=1 Tax=Micromonospora zingiberis TaxID=2053011 RepID=UPI00197D8D1C|nr:DUF4350 domain-containing protein [Micromonospora zingiberis]